VVLGAAYFFDGLEIIQAPINPRTMPALGQALNEFAARGVGIVANQVFDSGRLLAGKVTESREGLIDFAAAVGGVSTIIIGTTNPAHLEENVAALERCS
jgi:sugar phosphate isomerase/epimerase